MVLPGGDRQRSQDCAPVPSVPVNDELDRPAVRMLHDRVLVRLDTESAERLSSAGIVIPATASVGRKLAWGVVAAVGQHVRQVRLGDRVLLDTEDRAEVEIGVKDYVLLRERDIHAVAAERIEEGSTGLYL